MSSLNRFLQRCHSQCGVLALALPPRALGLRRFLTGGVLPRRLQLFRLSLCLPPGGIEPGQFSGLLARLQLDSSCGKK